MSDRDKSDHLDNGEVENLTYIYNTDLLPLLLASFRILMT